SGEGRVGEKGRNWGGADYLKKKKKEKKENENERTNTENQLQNEKRTEGDRNTREREANATPAYRRVREELCQGVAGHGAYRLDSRWCAWCAWVHSTPS